MSYYNTPYFSINDLLESLGEHQQRQRQQRQRARPAFPGYQRYYRPRQYHNFQQPYYYYNVPYNGEDEDDNSTAAAATPASADPADYGEEGAGDGSDSEDSEGVQDEKADDANTLYRSLYGDGPYVRRTSSAAHAPQRPPIRRAPSLPRAPHPAQSVIDLLNSLGVNLPYPEEDLPTRKTFDHDTPIDTPENAVTEAHSEPVSAVASKTGPASSSNLKPADKPAKRPSFPSTTKSSLNLHAAAPSPKLDPLQISKPQLSKNLPFSPPINVYDRPDDYLVVVSIPGSDKNSFHVDFHPTSHDLVVKGEVKNKYHDLDSANDGYLKVSEQRFGNFERNIKFPTLPKIDDENVKATYGNGLLEIVLPKLKKSEPVKTKRRIEIEEVEDEELQREANGGFLN